ASGRSGSGTRASAGSAPSMGLPATFARCCRSTTRATSRCAPTPRPPSGAPGVLSAARDYLDEELLLAGAELVWRAGPPGTEKGHGICHGTSGNGFALLAAFERTQDELWLARARRFAVHALGQAGRLPGRYSLFTGGAGTALFAAACLDGDPRYAELVVRVGANVQPGQEVFLLSAVEHHELTRALARQAYRAGASYVHVRYNDGHTRRAMIELGPDEALTYSPEWLKTFTASMSGNAMIATTGDPEPELLADLDGERVGRAVPQEIVQIRVQQITENNVNWCGVGAPNEGWAKQVFGEPDVERLWEKVAFCMRLDEPDPVE